MLLKATFHVNFKVHLFNHQSGDKKDQYIVRSLIVSTLSSPKSSCDRIKTERQTIAAFQAKDPTQTSIFRITVPTLLIIFLHLTLMSVWLIVDFISRLIDYRLISIIDKSYGWWLCLQATSHWHQALSDRIRWLYHWQWHRIFTYRIRCCRWIWWLWRWHWHGHRWVDNSFIVILLWFHYWRWWWCWWMLPCRVSWQSTLLWYAEKKKHWQKCDKVVYVCVWV